MVIINPPKVLREKLGDDGVDALIEFLNKAENMRKADTTIVSPLLREKFGDAGIDALVELVNIAKER